MMGPKMVMNVIGIQTLQFVMTVACSYVMRMAIGTNINVIPVLIAKRFMIKQIAIMRALNLISNVQTISHALKQRMVISAFNLIA